MNVLAKLQWKSTKYGYEKYSIADANGAEIAFVHRPMDAKLIAAAPELLAFAEWCISSHFDSRDLSSRAGGAIALAKGVAA